MTNNEETAVMKNYFVNALALPTLYSDEAVETLIVQMGELYKQAGHTTGEAAVITAYIAYLKECAA